MAVAIGYALQAPPMVLFSLATVGYACQRPGRSRAARWPCCSSPSSPPSAARPSVKETKVDILVTPIVTILRGRGRWPGCIAPPIGRAASAFGQLIMRATELQPFWMGILVSVLVGIALTLPISSAAICSVLGLTGLAGGAAVAGCCANMVGFAVHVLPGKPLGRPGEPGPGHLHAADAQHREEPPASGCPPSSPPPSPGPWPPAFSSWR